MQWDVGLRLPLRLKRLTWMLDETLRESEIQR